MVRATDIQEEAQLVGEPRLDEGLVVLQTNGRLHEYYVSPDAHAIVTYAKTLCYSHRIYRVHL